VAAPYQTDAVEQIGALRGPATAVMEKSSAAKMSLLAKPSVVTLRETVCWVEEPWAGATRMACEASVVPICVHTFFWSCVGL
jgi:hypothetical protein